MRVSLFFLAFALSLVSCKSTPKVERIIGQVGLFYGDQIQERKEIILDAQSQANFGFRIELPNRRASDSAVDALVTRPGPVGRRVTEHLSFAISPNDRSLVHHLRVPPDSSGIWNVRVLVGSEVVLDRAFRVRGAKD